MLMGIYLRYFALPCLRREAFIYQAFDTKSPSMGLVRASCVILSLIRMRCLELATFVQFRHPFVAHLTKPCISSLLLIDA